MTKQEQIEKMARAMCGLCTEDKSCAIRYSTCSEVESQDCSYKESAEELICKGYRNADEVRKETAKEILNLIIDEGNVNPLTSSYMLPFKIFNKIKREYGVEVEEQYNAILAVCRSFQNDYDRAFERLKAQQQEIDELKTEIIKQDQAIIERNFELVDLEDKIDNGTLVFIDEPFYSEERQCWCVYQKSGDIVQTLFMTEEQAKTYKERKELYY